VHENDRTCYFADFGGHFALFGQGRQMKAVQLRCQIVFQKEERDKKGKRNEIGRRDSVIRRKN